MFLDEPRLAAWVSHGNIIGAHHVRRRGCASVVNTTAR